MEIAKAISQDGKILIMDEPTSAIGEAETEILFDAIRTLSAQGVGIIYVSHRLTEIFAIADEYTVFRDLTSYVGSDDVKAGAMEAEAVVKAMGGKGNVVIIEGPIGISAQIDRGKGNQQVLSGNPGIKVLEHKTANWSRSEAQALMENWLTAHPGQINGVIGQNDEMALGALEAIKAAGVDLKTIPMPGSTDRRDQ